MEDLLFRLFMLFIMGVVFIGLPFLGIFGYFHLYQHREKWCEKCNTWERMRRETGSIAGWLCLKCGWINQLGRIGCPSCGWYELYEKNLISRRGPFWKFEKEEIDLFYGIKTTYLAYEDRVRCPRHGVFTRYLPADVVDMYENEQYDEYWEG